MTSAESLRRRALILSRPIAFLVVRELRYFRTKFCFMSEKLKTDGDAVTQEGDVRVVIFLSSRAKLLTPDWSSGENTCSSLAEHTALHFVGFFILCPKPTTSSRFFGVQL